MCCSGFCFPLIRTECIRYLISKDIIIISFLKWVFPHITLCFITNIVPDKGELSFNFRDLIKLSTNQRWEITLCYIKMLHRLLQIWACFGWSWITKLSIMMHIEDSFKKKALIYQSILLEFLRNKWWGEYLSSITMMAVPKIVIICCILIIAQWSLSLDGKCCQIYHLAQLQSTNTCRKKLSHLFSSYLQRKLYNRNE